MFAVLKYSLGLKDLRHPVIWKHSQLIDIVELSQTFAFEFAVDISNQNLRSFVEMNLTAFVYHMILKVHEILCEYVQKSYCWFLCFLDQLHKGALKSISNSAL